MDVQKYIKRLKFARADMDRLTGYFRDLTEAKNFLNKREFFFGDPFVVKYGKEGDIKLALAIGKADEPVSDGIQVHGLIGEGAYELFDLNEIREQVSEIIGTTTANTSDIKELFELIDSITGSTDVLKEIVGSGFTGHGKTITLTDRIRKDEELAGISWHNGHGGLSTGRAHIDTEEVPYASGSTLMEMLLTVSDTINGRVAFEVLYDNQHNILKVVYGNGQISEIPLANVSIVEYVRYDSTKEELIIGYKSGEHGEITEVSVPVRDIINEWETLDTNTVKLNRTVVVDGKDQLSADIKVSDDKDNMLVAKEDGLYVSNSGVTKVETTLENINEVLKLAEDGHLPEGSFTGKHIQGIGNYLDAVNVLDSAITVAESMAGEIESKLERKLDINTFQESEDVTAIALNRIAEAVESNYEGIGHLEERAGGIDRAINQERQEREDKDRELLSSVDSLKDSINEEVSAREGIAIVKLNSDECAEIGDNVREAYKLINNGVESGPIVVYKDEDKDSWVYKIYIGHKDDALVGDADKDGWHSTSEIVPGSDGDRVIRFILTNKDGKFSLSNNFGEVDFDVVSNEIDTIKSHVEESEYVTATAINRLAEDTANRLGDVENPTKYAVVLEKSYYNGYPVISADVKISSDSHNLIKKRSDGSLFVDDKNVKKAIDGVNGLEEILDRIKGLLNTDADGHFIASFTGPHASTAVTYYDAINSIDNATSEAAVASRVVDFAYNKDSQEITITYTVNGLETAKSINVSDFVKDSFLTDVKIVTVDGIKYLEFSFKTYDGEPVPIRVPLTDFAVIYKDGDGIDRAELENNQVITVKIDDVARKNYLAKSANGLLVTGVTEEIEAAVAKEASAREEAINELHNELVITASTLTDRITEFSESTDERFNEISEIISGVTGETLSEFIKKTEVEDHLDSGSTMPVQNKVIAEALDDLVVQFDEMIESLTAITADSIEANEGYFSGLTANTVYADEYQNLPTATTEQFGVVILEDNLKDAGEAGSLMPPTSKAVYDALIEDEETVAAALNDLNNRKADASTIENTLNEYVRKDEVDTHLDSESTMPVQNGVVTKAIGDLSDSVDNRFDEFVDIISGVTGGTLSEYLKKTEVEDHLDSASTMPVQNKVIAEVLSNVMDQVNDVIESLSEFTADTIEVDNLTASTIYATEIISSSATIENISSQTIVTEEITASTANIQNIYADNAEIKNITAQTITSDEIEAGEGYFSGLTANTIYADEYQNLPTATTAQFGVVILDDELNSGSTNPVMNSVITKVILEDEEVVAAALNDLEKRKANKDYVDDAVDGVSNDLVTLSNNLTNNYYTKAQTYTQDEVDALVQGISGDTSDAYVKKGDFTAFTENVRTEFDATLTGVTPTTVGAGFVKSVVKDGRNVKATYSTIAISDVTGLQTSLDSKADNSVFNTYTGSTDSLLETKIDNAVFTAYTSATETTISGKADKTYVDANFFHDAEYVSSSHTIVFKDKTGNSISTVDASDFIKDGMVSNVAITNGNLVVTFNTDAGKEPISIPITDIFNTNNYYDKTAINAYTATTLNDVSANTGNIVVNVEKDGDKVKVTKSNTIPALDGITATTVSATTYNNLPTATTTTYGVVIVDDALTTGSTNPVQNNVITKAILDDELVTAAALNDLNNRKANIEDIPVSISELDGYTDIAMKTDLAGFLPLSGGTMTGNISGSTGNAVYMPGGFFQQSDERLKIFCGDVENALDKVNMIPTKYFYWKSNLDGTRNLGTSAQKVKEVFPEIVSGEETLSVDYSKLAIVALAAVKELTAKVEELQKEIDELKK